jgi:hypothetical protein
MEEEKLNKLELGIYKNPNKRMFVQEIHVLKIMKKTCEIGKWAKNRTCCVNIHGKKRYSIEGMKKILVNWIKE